MVRSEKEASDELIYALGIALLHHLNLVGSAGATVEKIHNMWNEWPKKAEPIELTVAALRNLEEDGYVEVLVNSDTQLWRRKIRSM